MVKINRKFQVLFVSFILGLRSFAVSVDDLIAEYEKNSYTTKINEKNMKKYDIKEKALKNGDWNEVSVNSDENYSLHGQANGLTMDNNVKYGNFYYKNSYNFRTKELTENKIGISKTLNDYFGYSDNSYNKKTNQISRDIQKITNETTKNGEIRDLIDLYKNYKNKQKDENSQLKYDNLGRELKILGEQFMIYNVKLPEKEKLDDLKREELKKEDFYELRLSEAEAIELNTKLNEEQIKKENIDYKYPKLTGDLGYSLKDHSVVAGLSVSKTFKRYNDTIEDLKNEKEKLELQYEQKKNELVSNVGQQMITYTTYQTNELTAENTMNIKKKEYEIYAKRYELGVDTYSNYVEKRNNYKKAVMDYETAKNELAAFTKKIKYYK